MSDLEKVRQFLKEHGASYTEFLRTVRAGCEEVATDLGGQVILRVYDRTDKQGGEALKDAVKVLDAVSRPVRITSLKKVADVTGVTVVVQYPDQIPIVLDRLKVALEACDAVEERRKVHNETYFATHATYASKAVAHGGVLCEVQCKTVLHDAWSAKMHDLTYKPLGSMDPRMKGLIEAISLSLQGIEQQSQIARDMIVARQAGERKPFKASLDVFLSGVEGELLKPFTGAEAPEDPLSALREEVKEFATGNETAVEHATDLGVRIQKALEDDGEAGSAWLVAVRFASALPERDAYRFLGNAAETLFDGLQSIREASLITEAEIRAIPIGFYALQDFGRALESVDRIMAQSVALHLSEECVRILKFNKATWLLERESLKPSKPKLAQAIREEVEGLLAEVRSALTLKDAAVVKDTEGLMLIVYGPDKETIRRGIELCMEAGEPIDGDEQETAVALAYAEWRNQVGWRRFFEMAESEIDG